MLEPIAEGLWSETRPLRFLGLETGTRMTVIRLAAGGLVVHSPVALTPATRQAVEALGPVQAVVAPSRFHHLFVGEWLEAFPSALACGCPGLERKRPDIAWARRLGDEPEPEWRGEIDQVFFAARPFENEVALFHSASRTLVCADLLFHLSSSPSRLTRAVALLLGNRSAGTTWLERVLVRDRAAAREQVDRMLAWQPQRILLAHGDPIERDATEVLRRAYAWL